MTTPSERLFAALVLAVLSGLPALAAAQDASCPAIASNAERLACYDRASLLALPGPAPATEATEATEATAPAGRGRKDSLATFNSGENDRLRSQGSTLADNWELDAASKRGVFVLRPYKPIYVLPVSYTTNANQSPSSSAPGYSGGVPGTLDATEARFQFSLKTKAMENLFGDNGDLWLGYTQSSRWQVYNGDNSRPFRETNYEPEAMLAFRTNYEVFGFKGSLASIGVNHQSNGRALPLSRSWNRVIAQAGFERGDWMVMLRPWWRLPENEGSDENPGIENYIGRGELVVSRQWQSHVFSLQARHSLRGGDDSRGSAQLAWSFPIAGDLKGYVQVFSGYGESLIDYNHRQTVIGLGVSVFDWY
jgi:phospholipase A1